MTERPTDNQKLDESIVDLPAGKPSETAVDGLNPKGHELSKIMDKALAGYKVTSGGRGDMPSVLIQKDDLTAIAGMCKKDLGMDMLHCLFAVDYEDYLEINYVLFSIQNDQKLLLKIHLPAEKPSVSTLEHLWISANWYERETRDLFGVEFDGSSDLSPLLLFDGFEGNPGLRSFPLHDYEEW
tara:strand:- start:7939 stop:8487 length:549 start_codon:yes stop_codon:yes gene_type:complete